jgi:hypothetical protein
MRGTGTPEDRDEVKRREVWECDGWVCDLEVIGESSMFKLIHSSVSFAMSQGVCVFHGFYYDSAE